LKNSGIDQSPVAVVVTCNSPGNSPGVATPGDV